jgi:hypothetical protein
MQVIGLCRFSYPALGGFQVEHDSIEDRIAYLYDPARMEERFRHFETMMLPGLKAQTDGDFTFVVVVGDTLPIVWFDRLMALLEDFPQARIQVHPPGPHRDVMKNAINEVRGDLSTPCLQFRHDDDDSVAVTYVERLRAAAADCAGLVAANRLVAIDFNRGFVARPGPEGIHAAPAFTPFWGVALALAVKPGVQQTIMNFAHNKLNRHMPTVSFTDDDMYVRGHNDYNDSRQSDRAKPVPMQLLDRAGEAMFKEKFAIDAAQVRTVFSAT